MRADLVCAIALSLTATATAVHVLVVGDSMGEFEGCNDGTTYGSSAIAHCCSGKTHLSPLQAQRVLLQVRL